MNNNNADNNDKDIFDDLKKEKNKSKSIKNKNESKNNSSTSNSSSSNTNGNSNTSTNNETNLTINSKENKNRIQRSFYITPRLDRELEKLKAQTGRDKSELVRIALNHMVKNVEVKK